MAVSKIIHQVWEGHTEKKIPMRLQFLARTWKEMNPDWEYHLWNGSEMEELVSTHFPHYLSLYKNFSQDVQRWDSIRYMILYTYGGVYTDLDTECFRSINPLMNDLVMGFGEEPPIENLMPVRIGNAFMASEKECGGWLKILEDIHANVIQKESVVETVMDTTGPNMINRLFARLKTENKATSLPYLLVTPVSKFDVKNYMYNKETASFHKKIEKAYCAHYFFGSWNACISLY